MNPTAYARAESLNDAVRILADNPGAMCIAGGTTVVDLMKERVLQPDVLIDISRLTEGEISVSKDSITIGALARMNDVADHPRIAAELPAVAQALAASASPQLRNMATIGGNLLQRTRCVYFRDVATPCNKRRRGEGCCAMEGWNRNHAVLGTSQHCIAAHPSDLAVALVACDAHVRIIGPGGPRTVALEHFYRLPGETPDIENELAHDEVIAGVSIPRTALAKRSLYLKLRDRASFEFALVSVAAGIELDEGIVAGVRLALGGVGTRPWRAREAEDVLTGRAPTRESFEAAAEAAMSEARAQRDNGFKIPLAKRAIVRALDAVVSQS